MFCARIVVVVLFLSTIPKLRTQERLEKRPRVATIEVHADQSDGAFPPVWNYFGHDEPNYTYAANGRKLLGEIAALGRTPAHIRVHNIPTSGDGSASLKWRSTNVYTEDAAGNPQFVGAANRTGGREGVRAQPEINAIATRKEEEVEAVIWNYHDDDLVAAPATIELTITGLSLPVQRGLLEHFRVDSDHSNAFSAWKSMASPAAPTPSSTQNWTLQGNCNPSIRLSGYALSAARPT
jgi:hypothetical protein